MMAQDLTKFTVVLVLLGLVLAIAVFRPQVFPPLTSEPNEKQGQALGTNTMSNPGQWEDGEESHSYEDLLTWQEELEQCERGLDQRDTELNQREAELNQGQAELDERETKLEERAASLQAWEERLTEQASLLGEKESEVAKQLAAIQVEQVRLAQERESLQAKQTRLAQEQEELQSERAYLDEEWARLREKEANLAEWEQKLEGRQRLSVVAVAVSGLLSVPSVVVLVALMRQGQQTPNGKAQRAQVPEAYHRKHATQPGRGATEALALAYSDDGRDYVV